MGMEQSWYFCLQVFDRYIHAETAHVSTQRSGKSATRCTHLFTVSQSPGLSRCWSWLHSPTSGSSKLLKSNLPSFVTAVMSSCTMQNISDSGYSVRVKHFVLLSFLLPCHKWSTGTHQGKGLPATFSSLNPWIWD